MSQVKRILIIAVFIVLVASLHSDLASAEACAEIAIGGACEAGACDDGSYCAEKAGFCGCVDCTDNDGDDYYVDGCGASPDCDDGADTINPGASEVCDNEKDDDCDGETDENCEEEEEEEPEVEEQTESEEEDLGLPALPAQKVVKKEEKPVAVEPNYVIVEGDLSDEERAIVRSVAINKLIADRGGIAIGMDKLAHSAISGFKLVVRYFGVESYIGIAPTASPPTGLESVYFISSIGEASTANDARVVLAGEEVSLMLVEVKDTDKLSEAISLATILDKHDGVEDIRKVIYRHVNSNDSDAVYAYITNAEEGPEVQIDDIEVKFNGKVLKAKEAFVVNLAKPYKPMTANGSAGDMPWWVWLASGLGMALTISLTSVVVYVLRRKPTVKRIAKRERHSSKK